MSSTSPPDPDDKRWTIESAPGNSGPAEVSSTTADRLVVLGYITAVSMPPIGLMMGIAFALRSGKAGSKHGPWIIAVSLIAALGWVLIIAGGAFSTPSSDF